MFTFTFFTYFLTILNYIVYIDQTLEKFNTKCTVHDPIVILKCQDSVQPHEWLTNTSGIMACKGIAQGHGNKQDMRFVNLNILVSSFIA